MEDILARINAADFSKLVHPVGHGYDYRPNGVGATSIIVHTTNGNRGSSFVGEARFIQHSPAIGAHFLVGKGGQIAQFLPVRLRAWHAGVTLPGFYNSNSIGIECHLTPGEQWTSSQRQSLTGLVQYLVRQYGIQESRIETHRAVALPKGRKIDPSEWSDADFYAWRRRLFPKRYRVVVDVANIRAQANTQSRVVGTVTNLSEPLAVVDVVKGQTLQGDHRWAMLANDRGYVWLPLLEAIDG